MSVNSHKHRVDKQTAIIVKTKPGSVVSEQFRTVRTNIQYSMVDKSLKSIVITSAVQGAGKSFVAANLSSTFALENKRVLLVDADLRKPTVHRTFNFNNHSGLTTLLTHPNEALSDLVYLTDMGNLSVLTSGPIPPNPSELLATKRMEELIEMMESEYDLVIFDMPPILAVTDAQIMSGRVDGVIFVIPNGKATKDEVMKSKKMLDMIHANVIGAVMNRMVPSKHSHYYYKE
ncbi:Tyrosine-protein kinase EpsD [Alkalibacterium sp. AK22]|uniref:CpsD/CapB family tyrosine-protein kinase n=1 Tax=Alkalibacterium sp. AK22 TaxID=1229520 RepID=UPI00044C5F43|nr:CpsD/CapB family tyrosine-protein kinase [Alkalibacterium sp. AK22]EXJ23348.1 Tyrosine-protein kinase EpsD [Alkalibacterium sp. AK22]